MLAVIFYKTRLLCSGFCQWKYAFKVLNFFKPHFCSPHTIHYLALSLTSAYTSWAFLLFSSALALYTLWRDLMEKRVHNHVTDVLQYRMLRHHGLMPRALNSTLSSASSSPGWGHCVMFLDKTLYSHSASLQPSTSKSMLRVTLWWTSIPSRGSRKLILKCT